MHQRESKGAAKEAAGMEIKREGASQPKESRERRLRGQVGKVNGRAKRQVKRQGKGRGLAGTKIGRPQQGGQQWELKPGTTGPSRIMLGGRQGRGESRKRRINNQLCSGRGFRRYLLNMAVFDKSVIRSHDNVRRINSGRSIIGRMMILTA